ncbi:hypothetical protein [Chitinivorax sp. B]|nr:hypothetical protein [Chitinivorax sp. B]
MNGSSKPYRRNTLPPAHTYNPGLSDNRIKGLDVVGNALRP